LKYILYLIEFVLIAYFIYVSLYTFVFSIASLFYKNKIKYYNSPKRKFAVLIPAYKEDQVIISVAEKAVGHNYSTDKFEVFVIADSLKDETVERLSLIRNLNVVKVAFEQSTKVKSLNKAFEYIGNDHEFEQAVILDADNVMADDFLNIVNELHNIGFKAIQGQRAAKNENNTMSFLDGLSESINNSIYGKGSTILNCSSSLKGSGMSFDFETLKNELFLMNSIGGFDRELELRLTSQNINVYYADSAVVLDEKVGESEVFKNQRRRWISSQYYYLARYFWKGVFSVFKGRFNLFNSIILRNIQLPRLINLGLVNILFIVHLLGIYYLQINNAYGLIWGLIALILDLGVLLAIPRKYYNRRLLYSMLKLPLIFGQMFLLLFKLKGANKKFIHTPHKETN
jgi:cellulose synthase/poly-beta-1,6-N-acetylglucosamine synthase-like glycosyltransferase